MSVIQDTSEYIQIIKRIYPIGSIIFTSQPLGNKTEWTDIPDNGELTVEWEGMIWRLIVDNRPPAMYTSFNTNVFTVRNCFVKYTRESNQDPWTARIFYDAYPEEYPPPSSNIVPFTGANTHRLITDEMPYHTHAQIARGVNSGASSETQWGNYPISIAQDKKSNYNVSELSNGYAGGLNGTTQPHNNKEEGYNCFFYERIQ